MNKSNKLLVWCATLGPVGSLPAPGTWGSLVAVAIAGLCAHKAWYPGLVLVLTFFAWFVLRSVLLGCSKKDPNEIVLDELVGCLITFLWLPITMPVLVTGFLLFRFFDITKYCGVAWFEFYKGAWGVLLDDCFAGLLAGLVLRFLIFWHIL